MERTPVPAWRLPGSELRQRIAAAAGARRALADRPGTTAYRLINGAADGLPGFTLDRFAHLGVLSLYEEANAADETRLARAASEAAGLQSLY
ncbi:MAG TPA: hypothetical protein VNT60_11330, partial [Deinococcales bacterium]|nr:hypothetical protein [Deinococcales bacterium]